MTRSLQRRGIVLALLCCTSFFGFRFPDAHEQPPKNWSRPFFKLRQDYPASKPDPPEQPWKKFSFVTEPEDYLWSVLWYAYEGNVDNDWRVENNDDHRWYHAPWLHWGDQGREFIHGLTRERSSRPFELSCNQVTQFQNWAVSMFNEPGGYVIGQVWANPAGPNPAAADFPEGTVIIKLLFTTATPTEVAYLEDSPEWEAYIDVESGRRDYRTLRLLQIDLAVRDDDAKKTGWVFGTFQYDSSIQQKDSWKKIVPVALTWGNDEGVTPDMVKKGRKLRERWINRSAPIVKYRESHDRDLGWAGRANGPVDNERSSCLSCHSTAQYPSFDDIVPPKTGSKNPLHWFRNLERGEPFGRKDGKKTQSLDYSLQLAIGIKNFYDWIEMVQLLGSAGVAAPPEEIATTGSPALLFSHPFAAPKKSLASPEGVNVIYHPGRDEDERPAPKLLSPP